MNSVMIFSRTTVGTKRRWVVAKGNRIHPEGTVFYLRWRVDNGYQYESLGCIRIHDAQLKRTGKELDLLKAPTPMEQPTMAKVVPLTLEQHRCNFLKDKNTTVRSDGTPLDAGTIKTYAQVSREFVDTIKCKTASQITRNVLKEWLAALRARKLEHSTVCAYYRHMVCFLHFCGVDAKTILPRNERPKPVDDTPEAYTHEEMEKFFFNIVDEKELLAFEFLLKTGAREKEMTNLRWESLNLDKRTVTFGSSTFRTKTGKKRTVPLERGLVTKLIALRDKSPTTFVFGGESPCETYLKQCKRIAKRAGLDPKKFWLHKFRDTFATWSLRRGVDIRTVQHWLGHSSILMTQKYLAPEQGEAAQAAINSAFSDNASITV